MASFHAAGIEFNDVTARFSYACMERADKPYKNKVVKGFNILVEIHGVQKLLKWPSWRFA